MRRRRSETATGSTSPSAAPGALARRASSPAAAAALKRTVKLWRPPTCQLAERQVKENERLLLAAEAAARVLAQPTKGWAQLVMQGEEGVAPLHPKKDEVQLKSGALQRDAETRLARARRK